ncbi:MAG: MalY/PatB family protein [Candidatus Nanopelagicales bacterium]
MTEANPTGRTSAKWGVFDPDVLPLWVAEMDFPLAPPIAQALRAAIDRSDTGYRWDAGLPEALAGFAQRRLDWTINPAHVTTMGDVLVAIEASLRHLAAPGAVVVTPPVYPPFFSVVARIVGRDVVEVPLVDRYQLDLAGLEAAFTRPEVSTFLLSSPHNPTGTIHPRATLEAVARLARAHDVLVIADEIWAPLPLGGRAVTPYLTLGEDLTGPDISLVSASKAFNLAGLKCAQMVPGSQETADRLRERMPMEVTYSASHLGVIAQIAAYTEGDAWLDETLAGITRNAELLRELLARELPAVRYSPPEATYLAWLDCRDLGLGDAPAVVFRDQGRVALNDGGEFGAQGRGFVRLNLATTPDVIEEAVERMASVARA